MFILIKNEWRNNTRNANEQTDKMTKKIILHINFTKNDFLFAHLHKFLYLVRKFENYIPIFNK